MARRAAHPTSKQPAAPSRNKGDPHIQPIAHAPSLLQIHAFAASVLFVLVLKQFVGQAALWRSI